MSWAYFVWTRYLQLHSRSDFNSFMIDIPFSIPRRTSEMTTITPPFSKHALKTNGKSRFYSSLCTITLPFTPVLLHSLLMSIRFSWCCLLIYCFKKMCVWNFVTIFIIPPRNINESTYTWECMEFFFRCVKEHVCKSKYILKLCGEKIMENYCCILVVCNEVPGFLMWHSVTWPPGIKIQKEGHIVILFWVYDVDSNRYRFQNWFKELQDWAHIAKSFFPTKFNVKSTFHINNSNNKSKEISD